MPSGQPQIELGLVPQSDGRASLHATTIAVDGLALLITGPSGAGKSGLAAQMICFGATLVSDDLTCLQASDGSLWADAPSETPALIELRGLGLSPIQRAGPTALGGCLVLGPSRARLPDPELVVLLEHPLPVYRHPPSPDLAAKLILMMRGWARHGGA